MVIIDGTFPQSKDLKEIIEGHNWTLYDVSNPPEERAHTWEELDKMAPADQYEVWHNYLFVPIPKNGETLREAYTPTKGLGPSLSIDYPGGDWWEGFEVLKKPNGVVALFSRLFMHEKFACVISPVSSYLPKPDIVAIKYGRLIDTFRQHFRIVSPEEYGLTVPISMPIIPKRD